MCGVLATSCGGRSGGAPPPDAADDAPPPGDQAATVSVGMTLNEVEQLLRDYAAESISDQVQIKAPGPRIVRWYLLADGTCVAVAAMPRKVGDPVVEGFTLGEAGRGYGDKVRWLEQRHRELRSLRLPPPGAAMER